MKLIKEFLSDLLVLLLPKINNKKELLIFLVHPRDEADMFAKAPFLKKLNKPLLRLFERLMWPVTVAPIKKKSDVIGYVISTPCTAKTMLHDRKLAKRKIKQALKLGYKKGGKIAALGALTASLTYGGKDIYDGKISITTGHAYTVFNINNILRHIIRDLNLDVESLNLAIVGAAGSIGAGSARLAAGMGFNKITLIDLIHKKDRVMKLLEELQSQYPKLNIVYKDTLDDIKEADVLITATNHPDALVSKKHIRPPLIIIDDAQPSDIAKDVFDTDGVLVLEGGAAHTPRVNIPFPLGLCHKNDNFSCMAESLLLF